MLKSKLSKYLISEVIKYYFFTLVSLSILFWIMQAARYLYMITDMGMPIIIYSQYILLQFPKILSQFMLISFLISLFLVLIKLQENKEIEIYFLSGISKFYIIKVIFYISIIITTLALFFYSYLVPFSNFNSREIISNLNFSTINLLVKKNNFNSPDKNLTIYVHKNDNKGNLEKIYIFETNKTIISQKGRILEINNKNYLELINGIIHEKNTKNNITSIKFEKTLYDFTKFQTNLINYPKIQERDLLWIFKEYASKKNPDVLYEIHKRLIKPLFIPSIAILCCFILFSNNEKINLARMKVIIFSFVTLFLILIEIFLNLSVINNLFKYTLYASPLVSPLFFISILNKFLINEAKAK